VNAVTVRSVLQAVVTTVGVGVGDLLSVVNDRVATVLLCGSVFVATQ
jgi:hypothetical protein